MRQQESCPTVIMDGDKIVEVALTVWEEINDVEWKLVSSPTIFLNHVADRVIFELPHGCFETDLPYGLIIEKITFSSSGPQTPMRQCQRRRVESVREDLTHLLEK